MVGTGRRGTGRGPEDEDDENESSAGVGGGGGEGEESIAELAGEEGTGTMESNRDVEMEIGGEGV